MNLTRASLRLFLVSSLLIGGAVLILMSVAPLFIAEKAQIDISREECPNKIENYKNSVNWYRGPNRITVKAKTACGSKYGEEYDLSDVTIEIRSGRQVITQAHAGDGTFWPGKNEMLIGKSDQSKNFKESCVPDFAVMQIDLKTGEMRTPGMQAFLNSASEVKCSNNKRRSHG
jgi:hypothetical protein